jgi:hypothetical protein
MSDPAPAQAPVWVEHEEPKTHICPISDERMQDPVIDYFGHTYERASIVAVQHSHVNFPLFLHSTDLKHMHVCVYVCMYVCMYVCVHVHDVCMYYVLHACVCCVYVCVVCLCVLARDSQHFRNGERGRRSPLSGEKYPDAIVDLVASLRPNFGLREVFANARFLRLLCVFLR